MSPLVHRDVTASGVRLRVAEAGSGPAVLLIHGLFVDHTAWDRVMPALAERFRVVAPDLPGFGASEKPKSSRFAYDIEAFTEAIADLYAGLELGRAALVGHGLGGAIALTLAARHPELVSRLVLVDPVCYSAGARARARLALLPLVGGVILKQLWGSGMFRAYFQDTLLGPGAKVSPDRVEHYYEAFNTPAARESALATLRATVDTRSVVAQTTRLHTRALVIWGRRDRLCPPSDGQRLAREIPGAGLEYLDAGHSPHEECPDELARIVLRFLSEA